MRAEKYHYWNRYEIPARPAKERPVIIYKRNHSHRKVKRETLTLKKTQPKF